MEEANRQFMEENESNQKENKDKKNKFKEQIEDAKIQKEMKRVMEKQLDLEDKQVTFFPFTHGDHIERQRQFMKAELKDDMKAR